MIILIKIRLTSPILGENRLDSRGVRKFKKRSGGDILIDKRHWNEQLDTAKGILKLPVNNSCVIIPDKYVSPTLHLYRRRFSGTKIELFESIRTGTVLTFELATREDQPNCPTLDQIEKMLVVIGEHLGLSQWGSKFGFGRFKVQTCLQKNVNLPSESTDSMVVEQYDDHQPAPGAREVSALPTQESGASGVETGKSN